MNTKNIIFKNNFSYNVKQIEKYIKIIQNTDDDKRKKAYKNLVFKMMKDVVERNISNYLNLLKNVNLRELPERDELISYCFIVFDKCVQRFIVDNGYNFYFFYNKSLSRNFYRNYNKELKRNNNSVEINEVTTFISPLMRVNEKTSIDLLMTQLGFSDLEKRICLSRIRGQRTSEFLEDNKDISNAQYSRILKGIKNRIIIFKNHKEL